MITAETPKDGQNINPVGGYTKKIKMSRRKSFQAPTLKQSNSDRGKALKVVLFWKLHHCSAFPSPGRKKYVSFSEFSCDLPPNLRATILLYQLSMPLQVKPTAALVQHFDL